MYLEVIQISRTPDQVSADIRQKLQTSLPGLSLELGTVERKIVDACSEAISEAYIDQYITGSLLDIETKTGLELEQMVGIFGFGRLQGRKATGIVRLELKQPATQLIDVPLGSQFFSPSGAGAGIPLYFAATQASVFPIGSATADIPVECTVAGSVGNVPPGAVSSLASAIASASVTNLTSMTGGIDVETDNQLRERFKASAFRNISGTADWYMGLAFQNKFVSKVAVFGPTSLYRTEIVVPSGSLVLPVNSDVKYAWPQGEVVFKNLGKSDEVFYSPSTDYTFLPGSSPQITRNSTGALVPGDIVDLEFEYTTRSSRNDPANGIANKVDVFVNGSDPYTVSERTVVSSQLFSSTTSSDYYTGKFARVGASGSPSTANRFMRLGSAPLVSFPPTVTIGATTYQQNVHYYIVRGTTLDAGTQREVMGLEWTPAGPASGTPLTLTYSYNRLPEILNALVKRSKQITTDVLVHEAGYRYLKLHLSVEYDRGLVQSQVNNAIQKALRDAFANQAFGAWIEMSDIMLIVHQVLGVDNVWITTSTEAPSAYGIQVFASSLDTAPISTETADFKLNDNQLPVFLSAVITRKANR